MLSQQLLSVLVRQLITREVLHWLRLLEGELRQVMMRRPLEEVVPRLVRRLLMELRQLVMTVMLRGLERR